MRRFVIGSKVRRFEERRGDGLFLYLVLCLCSGSHLTDAQARPYLSYERGVLNPLLYPGCLTATIFFDRPATHKLAGGERHIHRHERLNSNAGGYRAFIQRHVVNMGLSTRYRAAGYKSNVQRGERGSACAL